MRINLGLNLVSSQPLFSVGIGNLPETYGANRTRKESLLTCYQNTGKGRLPVGYQKKCTARRRTGVNGTKAYPTIHTYLLLPLTGDCLNQSAHKGYVADTENLAWQRSFHSSLRTLN